MSKNGPATPVLNTGPACGSPSNSTTCKNLAALMAPQDEKSLLMQRMEDSNLRQLWRLTNVLFKVRNGALTVEMLKMKVDPGMCMKTKARMTKCLAI